MERRMANLVVRRKQVVIGYRLYFVGLDAVNSEQHGLPIG